jgi:hypothetical protein
MKDNKTIKFKINNDNGIITTPILNVDTNASEEEIDLFAINRAVEYLKKHIGGFSPEDVEEKIDNGEFYKVSVALKKLTDLRLMASIIVDEQDNVINQVNDILKKKK